MEAWKKAVVIQDRVFYVKLKETDINSCVRMCSAKDNKVLSESYYAYTELMEILNNFGIYQKQIVYLSDFMIKSIAVMVLYGYYN